MSVRSANEVKANLSSQPRRPSARLPIPRYLEGSILHPFAHVSKGLSVTILKRENVMIEYNGNILGCYYCAETDHMKLIFVNDELVCEECFMLMEAIAEIERDKVVDLDD